MVPSCEPELWTWTCSSLHWARIMVPAFESGAMFPSYKPGAMVLSYELERWLLYELDLSSLGAGAMDSCELELCLLSPTLWARVVIPSCELEPWFAHMSLKLWTPTVSHLFCSSRLIVEHRRAWRTSCCWAAVSVFSEWLILSPPNSFPEVPGYAWQRLYHLC